MGSVVWLYLLPMLVGRRAARAILDSATRSDEAELVAVYGRRRVGKTFLVRTHLADPLRFELTGLHGAPLALQLRNFAVALGEATGSRLEPAAPADWFEAFVQLRDVLGAGRPDRPQVFFFDELPWLATPRSGFMPAFEHFWNTWASQQPNLVVVVCGSAASWMIQRVVRARGGLHNRVTRRIQLLPFTLAETHEYLLSRRIDLGHYQTIELYLALGGVPHYLKEVQRGESAAQAIDRVCFSPTGLLRDEYPTLFRSLFRHSERHDTVVRALAARGSGMTRQQLVEATRLPSGGTLTKLLDELTAAGFLQAIGSFGRRRKDAVYRLADPYCRFYLRWIEPHRSSADHIWTQRRGTPAWRAWSGYAFEAVCIQHIRQLKRALGIEAVETTESTWSHRGDDRGPGAQIDLLIDRKDATITLCELKFSEGPFTIDRRYAGDLRRKREVFRAVSGTRKSIQIAMVAPYGVTRNTHHDELVARTVDIEALFEPPRR